MEFLILDYEGHSIEYAGTVLRTILLTILITSGLIIPEEDLVLSPHSNFDSLSFQFLRYSWALNVTEIYCKSLKIK